jgi:hypothetical protein
MAQEPDRIKDDIDATRTDLARNVDALADRTVPTRVARRRWNEMKDRVRTVSDKVMGTPNGGHRVKEGVGSVMTSIGETTSQVGDKATEMASDVASAVREAPHAVAERTQGNPLAAGIIAFGVGLLTASLIPPTDLERRAGQRIKDQAGDLIEPIKEPLSDSFEQIKDDVTDAASSAVDEIKQSAKDAAGATKDKAMESADTVKGAAARS